MTDDETPDPAEVTNAFFELMASMSQVLEAAVGYRAQCEEQGFSPSAAETMAQEVHSHLIAICFSSMT